MTQPKAKAVGLLLSVTLQCGPHLPKALELQSVLH